MHQVLTFHRLRNQAMGVTEDPQFERGLAWAAKLRREQEETGYLQAVLLNGIIAKARADLEALPTEAETPEERNEILTKAQQLMIEIEQATLRLEQLADGELLSKD